MLHPLPGKPLWDLMAWITSSPSATSSSTETRPLSTEDAPRGDPESWATQGTEWGQPTWTLQGRVAGGFPDLSPACALLSTGSCLREQLLFSKPSVPSGKASGGTLNILLSILTSSCLYSAAGSEFFLHKLSKICVGLKASRHML